MSIKESGTLCQYSATLLVILAVPVAEKHMRLIPTFSARTAGGVLSARRTVFPALRFNFVFASRGANGAPAFHLKCRRPLDGSVITRIISVLASRSAFSGEFNPAAFGNMLTLHDMSLLNPLWKTAMGLRDPKDQAHTGAAHGVLLWVLVCLPAPGIGQAPVDSLIACTQLTADTTRLACFDREIAEIRKSAGGPSKSSESVPTPEQKFGFSGAQARALEPKPAQAPPSAVHAQIVSVSGGPNGRRIFVLDNSQTWQQVELEPDFSVRNGQSVTISNGVLGSFWLSSDSHRATRVKRIR